jgi:hypothetical protein
VKREEVDSRQLKVESGGGRGEGLQLRELGTEAKRRRKEATT